MSDRKKIAWAVFWIYMAVWAMPALFDMGKTYSGGTYSLDLIWSLALATGVPPAMVWVIGKMK